MHSGRDDSSYMSSVLSVQDGRRQSSGYSTNNYGVLNSQDYENSESFSESIAPWDKALKKYKNKTPEPLQEDEHTSVYHSRGLGKVLKVPEDKIRLRVYLNNADIRDGKVIAINNTKRYLTMEKYRNSEGEIVKDTGLDAVKRIILKEIVKELPYFNTIYLLTDPPTEVTSFEQLCEEFIPYHHWAHEKRKEMFKKKHRKWLKMSRDFSSLRSQNRAQFMKFTPEEEKLVTPYLDVVCVDYDMPEDIKLTNAKDLQEKKDAERRRELEKAEAAEKAKRDEVEQFTTKRLNPQGSYPRKFKRRTNSILLPVFLNNDPVNVYKVTLEMYPEDSKNYYQWCDQTRDKKIVDAYLEEKTNKINILMEKFFKTLNKEVLKVNHPNGIKYMYNQGPKKIYKIISNANGKKPTVDTVEHPSEFQKEVSYIICSQSKIDGEMEPVHSKALEGTDYIYDHFERQRKMEALRRSKYDPLAAIASEKARKQVAKEKKKREQKPLKEDYYPSEEEEETTVESTPVPTPPVPPVTSSSDFNLMADRQTSTTSFDDWVKSQERKKTIIREKAAATQTIAEEVPEKTVIKVDPALEQMVDSLVEIEGESEPKDDENIEAAIKKIENEGKRLNNGKTKASNPPPLTYSEKEARKAQTQNAKKSVSSGTSTHSDRQRQKTTTK